MVVQNVSVNVDSVDDDERAMDMDDYQIGVHYNLDELQRTNVGSYVPSVAARVPCLNCVGGGYVEQPNFAGISPKVDLLYLV